MATAFKQLGQARENSTNAVSVYSPGAGETAIIPVGGVVIANNTASPVAVRLFCDDNGTTYDQSTALMYDVTVPANYSIVYPGIINMHDATGNLAYRSATANALTITVFGALKS